MAPSGCATAAHLLIILQVGVQRSSPELRSVGRETKCPPISSVLETFRFEDFFQRCVVQFSFQMDIDVV